MRYSLLAALVLAGGVVCIQAAKAPKSEIAPDVQSALDRISPNGLRGDISFLASDLLEGRGSPSRGLDVAAEFIASEFRRAGLEPAVNGDYFQVAQMETRRPDMQGFKFEISADGRTVSVAPDNAILEIDRAIDLKDVPVVRLSSDSKPEDLNGKVVISATRLRSAREILRQAHPALVVMTARRAPDAGFPSARLTDPSETARARPPRLIVFSKDLADLAENRHAAATATVHIAAPVAQKATLRNVIGVLPGSDPALKDTYVIVSAHYDHLGMKADGEDRIYNGANDDASGTASVIEIANALAGLKQHPARSIVFMAFFGEEEGLIGSEYYVHHPVFPLAKTIANVNLEQMGRTDSTDGKQVGTVAPTGYGYSSMLDDFKAAAEETGVKMLDAGEETDRFFTASDNYSFAEAGIPAHTFCVAFQYPDYHGVGDEWRKIDYDNMARVDRTMALGIVMLSGDSTGPQWNASNPKAKRFADARKSNDAGQQ